MWSTGMGSLSCLLKPQNRTQGKTESKIGRTENEKISQFCRRCRDIMRVGKSRASAGTTASTASPSMCRPTSPISKLSRRWGQPERTLTVALNAPPALVANGPHRFTGNPMLTGVFMQLFGIAVSSGSLSLGASLYSCFHCDECGGVEEGRGTRTGWASWGSAHGV